MTEQIKFQFREDDNEEWKDVVDGSGEFIEPSWCEGFQYRRKPEPEVVKPVWPRSTMSEDNLYDAYESAYGCFERYLSVADAAIAHALETGLVVLPQATPTKQSTANRDSDLITEGAKWMYNKLYSIPRTAYCDIKIDYEQILAKVEG